MRALLIAAVAAATLLTPVPASAAACTWTSAELSLPTGTIFSAITGASADGSHVLGLGRAPQWQDVALSWHNGSVESVPLEPGQFPNDVNASGTILISSSEGRAHRGGAELNPLPGAGSAWAAAINASGAAVGRSGSRMVIWPADSPEPRLVPGTDDDASWTVAGIDDQGRVAAWRYGTPEEPTLSYVWDENGARTLLRPLRGHSETRVNGIRNGRLVGYSAGDHLDSPIGVEWDLLGNVVRTFAGSADAQDVTSSGDVLGLTEGAEFPGPAGVWRANGDVDQPPATVGYEEFTDDGALYGGSYDGVAFTPVRVTCG